jgi:hypothetical protein
MAIDESAVMIVSVMATNYRLRPRIGLIAVARLAKPCPRLRN